MSDQLLFAQIQPATLAGAGCSIGDTTLILSSFQDIDGNNLAMTDFGAAGYATIEPGNSTQEEQVSFTGLVQNSNGTCTLSGVKNVAFLSPYTETSGVLKTHPGGAKFIISNTSGFYNQLTSKENDETITGLYTFTQLPVVPTPDGLTASQVASVGYVNSIAIAGAPKASTTQFGIVELSTAPVTASIPIAVGNNDTRVSPVSLASLTASTVAAFAGTSGTPSSLNKYVTNADTTGTGSIYRGLSGDFGDGNDGALVYDGSTTILGMVPSVNVYTLTRDIFATTITVNTGVTIKTGGYKIYATTSITNNGTIQRDGVAGGNAPVVGPGSSTGGTAGVVGTALSDGSLPGSSAGAVAGAGGNGAAGGSGQQNGVGGTAGSNLTNNTGNLTGVTGANGGASGSSGTGGGSGAAAGTTSSPITQARTAFNAAMAHFFSGTSLFQYTCSASNGGAGGGGGGTGNRGGAGGGGGGSGSNGGWVALISPVITNSATGVISAKGGNGGNGAAGEAGFGTDGAGGGGGGGGTPGNGGVVVLVYKTLTNSGSISVAAGTVGTQGTGGAQNVSGGAGASGIVGTTGVVGTIIQVVI